MVFNKLRCDRYPRPESNRAPAVLCRRIAEAGATAAEGAAAVAVAGACDADLLANYSEIFGSGKACGWWSARDGGRPGGEVWRRAQVADAGGDLDDVGAGVEAQGDRAWPHLVIADAAQVTNQAVESVAILAGTTQDLGAPGEGGDQITVRH